MKLAAKLITLTVGLIATFLVVDAFLAIHRERRVVQEDMSAYALLVGRTLCGPIADIWNERGMDRALELLDDVNKGGNAISVRWVWLNAGSGEFEPKSRIDPSRLREHPGLSVVAGAEDGDERLLTYVPTNVPGGRPGALELSESLERRDARVGDRIKHVGILLGGVLAASAAAILFLGVKLVGRPLDQLAEKAERVGAGDLSGPLDLRGAGELSDLARRLNRMCEDLAASRARTEEESERKLLALGQLRHADRLKTVGRLAAGIAHELGTPLNVISGRAAMINNGTLSTDEVNESAGIIYSQAGRMAGIIRQLLDFARRGTSEKRILSIDSTVSTTCKLLEPAANESNVTLEASFGADRPYSVRGNESEIQQVISNLLMNAIQSMPQGGTVRVEVSQSLVPPQEQACAPPTAHIRVAVIDEGVGIAEGDLQRIFEPFFTTKDVGRGTGLGLSIVYGIIEDHGGWVEAESRPGDGSRFTIHIPEARS